MPLPASTGLLGLAVEDEDESPAGVSLVDRIEALDLVGFGGCASCYLDEEHDECYTSWSSATETVVTDAVFRAKGTGDVYVVAGAFGASTLQGELELEEVTDLDVTAAGYRVEGDVVTLTLASVEYESEDLTLIPLPAAWVNEYYELQYDEGSSCVLGERIRGFDKLSPRVMGVLTSLQQSAGAERDLRYLQDLERRSVEDQVLAHAFVSGTRSGLEETLSIVSSPEIQSLTPAQKELLSALVRDGADFAGSRLGRLSEHVIAVKHF